MPEIVDRKECNIWAYTIGLLAKSLKEITDEKHLITEEDLKEIGDLLRHLSVSVDAANEKCRVIK